MTMQERTKTVTLPPGAHFIGDPCFAMNQDDRSGFRRSFGEMNGPSHMWGQMSVVFNTLGGDGSRRDGESNRYPVELPGGITRWNYPVELPGGITRWNYPVELPGGITRWNPGLSPPPSRSAPKPAPSQYSAGRHATQCPRLQQLNHGRRNQRDERSTRPRLRLRFPPRHLGQRSPASRGTRHRNGPQHAEPDYGVLVVSAFTNGNWNVLNVIGADDLCFALAAAGVIRRHTGRLP